MFIYILIKKVVFIVQDIIVRKGEKRMDCIPKWFSFFLSLKFYPIS